MSSAARRRVCLIVGCDSCLMAKSFDPNFYVTCATVIPVLFLAVAVQGRTYESVLESALKAAQSPAKSETRARLLQAVAFAIWLAGVFGEGTSLVVLYRQAAWPNDRWLVLGATMILVVAASAGPLAAYSKLKFALAKELSAADQSGNDIQPRAEPGQPAS